MIRKRIIKKQTQLSSSGAEPRSMKISLPCEPWEQPEPMALGAEPQDELSQARKRFTAGARHLKAFRSR